MIKKYFNRVISFFLFLFLFTPAVKAIPVKVITYNIANTIAVPIHKKRSRALIVELEKMFSEANEKNEYFVLFLQETFSLKFIEDLKKLSEAHNVYMTHTYQTDSKTYKHGLAILTNLKTILKPFLTQRLSLVISIWETLSGG